MGNEGKIEEVEVWERKLLRRTYRVKRVDQWVSRTNWEINDLYESPDNISNKITNNKIVWSSIKANREKICK